MANYRDLDKRSHTTGEAMPAKASSWPSPHINFVAEYQVAGFPGIIELSNSHSKTTEITFDYVTQFIQVTNPTGLGADIYIAFTLNGINGKSKGVGVNQAADATVHMSRMAIPPATTLNLPVKCTSMYLDINGGSKKPTILAGYTNISTGVMPVLTGSDVG